MSAEGHDGASEHVDAVQDILQPITNTTPTVSALDAKDASEHRALDQKPAGHATEDDANVVTVGAEAAPADERRRNRSAMEWPMFQRHLSL